MIAAAGAMLGWLWLSWGAFGASSWNDVRLAPTFGLKLDGAIYPGRDGPANTWMYGPLPVWLLWPATWASGPAGALGIAGLINAAVTLTAIGIVCTLTPLPRGTDRPLVRGLAALLAIAIWPRATWQFIQADNFAIACGLVANVVLLRSPRNGAGWLAAALAMAGLACKQTAIAVPIAQVLWLGFFVGWRAAGGHTLRLAATGGGVALLLLATQDPAALWFSSIAVPGDLPWAEDAFARLTSAGPALAVHLALPVVVTLWIRRQGEARQVALPTLSWAVALPPGLAALFTFGGNINSLQGLALWLPGGLTVALALAVRQWNPTRCLVAVAAGVIALGATRIGLMPEHRWGLNHPRYDTAAAIAASAPGQVWFPWHPLVSVYAERRRYADEDGLAVRALAGRPMPLSTLQAHLPPRFSAIALPANTPHWGIAYELRPSEHQTAQIGEWRVDHWTSPDDDDQP